MIDLEGTSQSSPQAEVARFWHAAFDSPAISIFNTALMRRLIAIPGVTPKMMRKYAPNSVATELGHLDQTR